MEWPTSPSNIGQLSYQPRGPPYSRDLESMNIKVSTKKRDVPLQPIRISTPGWAGEPVKMEDGAPIQPLHCLPFVEGSTYGLELIYPYEKECHVVNDNGVPRFEWDYMN